MQSLVEHPGAVGVLAGLQGSGYGPGAFQANLVACHGEGEAGRSANAASLKREEKKKDTKLSEIHEGSARVLAVKPEIIQRPVEHPAAVRTLPRLQGRCQGLGAVVSNVVLSQPQPIHRRVERPCLVVVLSRLEDSRSHGSGALVSNAII